MWELKELEGGVGVWELPGGLGLENTGKKSRECGGTEHRERFPLRDSSRVTPTARTIGIHPNSCGWSFSQPLCRIPNLREEGAKGAGVDWDVGDSSIPQGKHNPRRPGMWEFSPRNRTHLANPMKSSWLVLM